MSELSVFESVKQDYEKEIYDLKQEIEYLRSVGSLGILDKKCKELQSINNKYKEILDKIYKMIIEVNDDEFYVNLSNKEKTLIDILKLLEGLR